MDFITKIPIVSPIERFFIAIEDGAFDDRRRKSYAII
jgi:hypothetical protein